MSGIKPSGLLNKIIRQALQYGGSGETQLTAERFLLAVIDAIMGNAPIRLDIDCRSELLNILVKYFFNDRLFTYTRTYLETQIEEETEASFDDVMYMKRRMEIAEERADEVGKKELTPEILLQCIMDKPSESIRRCIENAKNSNGSEDQKSEDAPSGNSFRAEGFKKQEPSEPFQFNVAEIKKARLEEEDPFEEFEDIEEDREPADPKAAVAQLTEKVRKVYDTLTQTVFGQENAISVFATGYFQAELLALTDKKRSRPRATFLFAGPPGVGKTFLAETAAEALKEIEADDEIRFKRFDMSEYSDKEANIEFCGSDKVYKDGKAGNVTSFVAKYPKCVILFDEIEKAHINVIHLFLQILDAGHIRDNHTDKEVSFKDSILIFTTNAGKQLYENSDVTDFSGVTRKVILRALSTDVNPSTGIPCFPAAICSRFASGNVVMFNHVTAHNLREIAKKEVQKHARNFEENVGIKVEIDEAVYTSLLFAEGGAADARMITSRAGTFFDDELFELFRLLDSECAETEIRDLEKIHIGVELPRDNKEIRDLFERRDAFEVLVFGSDQVCTGCAEASPETGFIHVQDIGPAQKLLHDHDVSHVFIDITYGQIGDKRYLNIEDIDSKARDFFWFVREKHPELPIYLLQMPERKLNAEEKLSFLRQGVRGFVTLSEDKAAFAAEIRKINEQLHQQKSMETLAKANKLVSFETAQSITDGGKTAEITLFDFDMSVAIDAEDSENILRNVSKPNVTFDQVIGAADAKKELRYFVDYLKNPKKYMGTGVGTPKGVLLYGPPGTGKTMLAKAMANESDVTFVFAEGNQFINRYQGVGRDRVKEIFRTARKYAPSILFIDEFDAIAKPRTGEENNTDLETTLTAFLTEMDGFKNDTTKPVFVLAATNFGVDPSSEKSLDPALLRRFDRRLFIGLPTKEDRIRYIREKLRENAVFALSEEKIASIAIRSTGMSLAQLESVIELSLRTAIRDGNLKVTDEIFDEAFETFVGGESKQWDESLLKRIARHEAGHTFLCWESGEVPSYVTIVARGDHGGYMRHDDEEGKMLYTKDELLKKIRTALGGRAAEIVYYGDREGISTGASGDLASATRLAKMMLCSCGMDEELGLAAFDASDMQSGALSLEMRKAVNRILDIEMKKAIRLIGENRASIDALVEKLLVENHLTGEEIKAVLEQARV